MTCPRCGAEVEQRFYGPCEACRSALRQIEKLPHSADPSWFVESSRGAGQSEHALVAYVGPRVDDVSFLAKEQREREAE